jgi:hypothetical protein
MTKRGMVIGAMVLGVAAIAFAAVDQYFAGTSCSATREFNQASPDGTKVVTVVSAPCESSTEVSVKLVDSGKTYLLLLASSPLTDPDIELIWTSPSSLELHYPAAIQVRIPPEIAEVRNFFGKTEVVYKPR